MEIYTKLGSFERSQGKGGPPGAASALRTAQPTCLLLWPALYRLGWMARRGQGDSLTLGDVSTQQTACSSRLESRSLLPHSSQARSEANSKQEARRSAS